MEVIIELIAEFLFEFLAEVGVILIEKVFDKVESDKKALIITKIIIYSLITTALLLALIISLFYKKHLIVIDVISYLIFILLSYYIIFLFQGPLGSKKVVLVTRWIVRIMRYVFAVSLIVLANITLTNENAKIILILGSIAGIIIFVLIDAFRIRRYKYNKNKDKEKKYIREE